MSKLTKIIGLGAVAAIAGSIGWQALADTPTAGSGAAPFTVAGRAPRVFGDPASRLALLKSELGVTAAQAPAWDVYAKTVEDAAAAMRAKLQATGATSLRAMSPDQRAKFRSDMQAQREQSADAVNSAATKLAATLDDGQKAKATTILLDLTGHGPGMGRIAVPGAGGKP